MVVFLESWRDRWAALRRTTAQLGIWSALLYGAHRGCARLPWPVAVYSYRLIAQPVATAPRLTARRAQAFSSRLLQPRDPSLRVLPADRATLKRRFAQGAECLALFRGDVMVASLWLHFGTYQEDEVRCRFETLPARQTCWDFDVFVDPRYRLTGAFAALWDAADCVMTARGVRASVSRISAFNLPSLRAHERLGAVGVGRADYLLLGRLQVMRATQYPWLHIAWGAAAGPTIRVDAGPALACRQTSEANASEPPIDGAFRGYPEG